MSCDHFRIPRMEVEATLPLPNMSDISELLKEEHIRKVSHPSHPHTITPSLPHTITPSPPHSCAPSCRTRPWATIGCSSTALASTASVCARCIATWLATRRLRCCWWSETRTRRYVGTRERERERERAGGRLGEANTDQHLVMAWTRDRV